MPEISIPYELVTTRGTLEFNRYDLASYYHLNEVSGLIAQIRSSGAKPRPGRDGSYLQTQRLGEMTPLLEGQLVFGSLVEREALARELVAHHLAILNEPGKLRWLANGTGGEWREVTVQALERSDIKSKIIKDFTLPLISVDPFILGETLHDQYTSFVTPSAGGGFIFPFSFPFMFADASGDGGGTFHNAGELDAYPIVRIYGDIVNPTIINQTTGLLTTLDVSVNAPDFVEIDMWNEKITLNGSDTTPLLKVLNNAVSSFWPLQPDDNQVRLIGSNANPATTRAELLWKDSYAQ